MANRLALYWLSAALRPPNAPEGLEYTSQLEKVGQLMDSHFDEISLPMKRH